MSEVKLGRILEFGVDSILKKNRLCLSDDSMSPDHESANRDASKGNVSDFCSYVQNHPNVANESNWTNHYLPENSNFALHARNSSTEISPHIRAHLLPLLAPNPFGGILFQGAHFESPLKCQTLLNGTSRQPRNVECHRIGHPYQSRVPARHKKPRTSFTKTQLLTLESRFVKQKYLASNERSKLASQLDMQDTQVKTWFQNRRTKWRLAHMKHI